MRVRSKRSRAVGSGFLVATHVHVQHVPLRLGPQQGVTASVGLDISWTFDVVNWTRMSKLLRALGTVMQPGSIPGCDRARTPSAKPLEEQSWSDFSNLPRPLPRPWPRVG